MECWSFRLAAVIVRRTFRQHRPRTETAGQAGAQVFGIVRRNGGFTAKSPQRAWSSLPLHTTGDTAYRRPLRRAVASAGEPSIAAALRNEVGVNTVTDRRFFLAGGAGSSEAISRPVAFRTRRRASHALRQLTSGPPVHYAHHQGTLVFA